MNRTERIKQLYGKKDTPTKGCKPQGILTPCSERQASLVGDFVRITFPKNKTVLDIVKRITFRRHIKGFDIQCWEAPASLDCLDKLREARFTISQSLLTWESDLFKPVIYNPHFTIPGIKHFDYFEEYQKEGVQFIEAKNGRALIADDPGLGKTMQVLAWLQLRQEINPILIICPANAKWTWCDEAHFWLPNPSVQIVNGYALTKIWGDFVIINFDILTNVKNGKDTFRKDIWDIKWNALIIDEGHYVTNSETIRGWAVSKIVDKTPHVIITTATPGDKNKHKFTLANFVDKRVFPSFYKFAHKFCDPKKNYVGQWDFNGSSNELELNKLLTDTIMLRRTKQEVFHNFPKILRQVVPLPINNTIEYEEADRYFEAWLQDTKGVKAVSNALTFQKIEALTKLAVKGKMDAAIDWLWDLLDSAKKIIIFVEHKEVVEILMEEFGSLAVKVDGSTSDKKKEEAKQLFQQCKRCKVRKEKHSFESNACSEYVYDITKRVFIGSRAAKESITLTAAYDEVFLEMWWSADDHTQAEGRSYGRKGDLHGATAWYLVAHGTIEEYKAKVYDIKNMRNEKVMNGRELSKEQMLTELLKEYRSGR